jgi:Raf kinase inhibitor-like YbhB/YbcL family protein
MGITSSSFAEGKSIPPQFTCDGANTPPPLAFRGVPTNAKSLALVMTDPDAPGGTFTHWILWNVPSASVSPAGGTAGTNDFGKAGYGGPCPPNGDRHDYVFTLYALDTTLSLPASAKRAGVERAIRGHVVVQAALTGRYRR